ncbi:MAG: Ig-like domain repeat protein, partial [Euryarchaeota archaeon]|nr:Ig-like domain repeat protein [Euryarchaeota archaeon]
SLDDDADAPQWADTSRALRSLQTVSGHSSDGRVRLAWDAADDTQDGDEPNRGIAEYQLSVLGPAATAVKAHTTLGAIVEGLPEGSHRFKVRPLDLAGNAGPWSNEIPILVDRTIPRISHQSNRTGGPAAGAFKEAFSITLTATDAGSGVASIQYRVDDETTLHAYEGAIPFTREAEYNLTVEARDRAGNLNRSSFRFVLDREAPVIAGGLSPGLPDGESGWYQKAPQLVITSTDVGHAGVHKLEYRLGTTGAWTAYTKATTLEKEGETLIDLRATDGANNAATTAVLLRLDSKTPEIKANLEGPKVSGDWYGGPVRLWANATDEGSGIGEVAYRLAEGPWSDFQNPLRLAHAGAQRVSVRAKDVAGAASPEKSFVVQIDGDKPVPPVPRWSTDSNGFLHVNWTGAGPADLGSGIARIAVEQMGSDGGALRSFAGSTSAQKASVGPFERGLHQFRVSVTDLAGNSASTPWTAIEILQSAGGLTSASQSIVARDQTVLQFIPPAGFEPLEVVFYVDGQIVSAHGSPPYRFSWDTQTVADGLHSIKVVARSTNGQVMEETASYDVRNEYVHVLEDHAVPFSLSLGACGIVFPASVILRRRWRTL